MDSDSSIAEKTNARRCDHFNMRIFLCIMFGSLSLILCLVLGFILRTPNLNPTSTLNPTNVSRTITLGTDLVDVDATSGTMTLDWTIENDSACNISKNPPCPGLSQNSTVDIFFDPNILLRNNSTNTNVLADNQPDAPIFRHNATALYALNVYNALPEFRTSIALLSAHTPHGSSSTLQLYPFDEYTVQILVFALDSETSQLVGLRIGRVDGIVVGYKAFATSSPPSVPDYPGVISEVITISRSFLVKTYAVAIVVIVWLMTIAFMFMVASIVCGHKIEVPLLLIPVSTLIAVPNLRGSMPGSPVRFGAIVDVIGLLPCLAFTSLTAVIALLFLILKPPQNAKTMPGSKNDMLQSV